MKSTLIATTLLFGLSGCATSLLEERVITEFVAAVDEENVPAMRRVVSTEFERKALRSDDVLRDLDLVKLPSGELDVVKVEESEDNQRSVIVRDGDGADYKFELVRDPNKRRWAVDDVLVRQQKKWKKIRSSVTWPTSQLMDLVFTVREYLDAWSETDRSRIIAKSAPSLAASLEAVPESWLPVITNAIATNYDSSLSRKPEAHLTDDSAVVRMPIRGGSLLVSAVQIDGEWLVEDIEIHSRSDAGHPGSVRRQADSIASLNRFLRSFENGDREGLQACSTAQFYDATLQFGDLSLVQLPSAETAPQELSIIAYSGHVTIVIPGEREYVRFELIDPTHNSEKHIINDTSARVFRIDNVILNDRTRRNERTLASVFTAPARASLFFEALKKRDTAMLKQLSTREFNNDVWNHITDQSFSRLTLPTRQLQGMKLDGSDVRGTRTELTFTTPQSGQVRCRMLEQSGRLLVDDVQYAGADHQTLSLRVQSALQVPIAQFTEAWRATDLEALKKSVSTGFDRLVLSNFTSFPPDDVHLADRLDTALRATRVTQERATVNMGLASTDTAEVHLIFEHKRWVIDDIAIPEGDGTAIHVRNQLRQQVVDNMRNGSGRAGRLATTIQTDQQPLETTRVAPRPVRKIQLAGGTMPEDEADPGVVNSGFQVFGPKSSEITRRLQNPMPGMPEPPVPPADPLSEPLAPAAEDARLRPVPVPIPESTATDEGPRFLRFGPAPEADRLPAEVSEAPEDTASVPTAPASAPKTLDLSANPVSID